MKPRCLTWRFLLTLWLAALCLSCAGSDSSEKALDAAQLKEMIETSRDDFVLLDVRTQEEYDAGHIPTAQLIPYTEIAERADGEIPRDKPVVVYCRTGRRSGIARQELLRLGYNNVTNFGGLNDDWPYPLEKGVPAEMTP